MSTQSITQRQSSASYTYLNSTNGNAFASLPLTNNDVNSDPAADDSTGKTSRRRRRRPFVSSSNIGTTAGWIIIAFISITVFVMILHAIASLLRIVSTRQHNNGNEPRPAPHSEYQRSVLSSSYRDNHGGLPSIFHLPLDKFTTLSYAIEYYCESARPYVILLMCNHLCHGLLLFVLTSSWCKMLQWFIVESAYHPSAELERQFKVQATIQKNRKQII